MSKKDLEKVKTKYITATREVLDIDDAYERLAVAIVEQAAKDANGWGYYSRKKEDFISVMNNEYNRKLQMESVKRFFLDDDSIFQMCMPNTDGEAIYNMIMHNYEVYGNYMPPNCMISGGGILL